LALFAKLADTGKSVDRPCAYCIFGERCKDKICRVGAACYWLAVTPGENGAGFVMIGEVVAMWSGEALGLYCVGLRGWYAFLLLNSMDAA
jgi:hypothetical protein